MLCIICKENEITEKDGIEHVIPESMGGSYTVKTICQKCNSKMNKNIDSPLINEYFMNHILGFFKVKNKNKEYPKIKFAETKAEGTITKLYCDEDCYYTHLQMPSKPKKEGNILKFEEDIRTPIKQIIKTSDTFANRLTRDDEEGKNYKISEESKKKMNENWNQKVFIDHEGMIEKRAELDIDPYSKLLVKVAHETAYEFLGNNYLMNSEGEKIRLFLKNSEKPINQLLEEYNIILSDDFNPKTFKNILESVHHHATINTINMVKNGEIVENPKRVHPSSGNFFHRIQLNNINNDFYIALHLFSLNNEWVYTGHIKVTDNINIDINDINIFKPNVEENVHIVNAVDTGKNKEGRFSNKH